MRIDLLSLFPHYFKSPLESSILKRALERGTICVTSRDIREFGEGKHKKVDDSPYGGGPGMVLMPGPVVKAVLSCKRDDSLVVYMSPQGEPLTPELARQLASYAHLIIVCGHYEGVDQRAIDLVVDRQVSIGDYVVTNGCLASLVLLDAMIRFIPGVLGSEDSAEEDSFQGGLLKGPLYTRPEEFEGLRVPEVLQSGNHAAIKKWRGEQSEQTTLSLRPEILKRRKEHEAVSGDSEA